MQTHFYVFLVLVGFTKHQVGIVIAKGTAYPSIWDWPKCFEVTNTEQEKIAEKAKAFCIVIYHCKFHMLDPSHACQIKQGVSILVTARVCRGHFVDARILEANEVDHSQLLGNVGNENQKQH